MHHAAPCLLCKKNLPVTPDVPHDTAASRSRLLPVRQIRALKSPGFPCRTQIDFKKVAPTTMLICSYRLQRIITHDRRVLRTDSKKDPEVRICTKGVSPHLQVLLCHHDVCQRNDGSHARSIDEEHGWRRRRKAPSTTDSGPVR